MVEFSKTAIFFRNPYVSIYPSRLPGQTYPQTAQEGIEYQKYIIDNNLIPPIYIILFLYGFFYNRLPQDKSGIHVELFNDYFIVLDNAYTTVARNIIEYNTGNTDAIPDGPNKAAELNFLNLFNRIFGGAVPSGSRTGDVGATGITDPMGITGAIGATGAIGTTGPTGTSSASGVSTSVSSGVASGVRNYASPISADSKTTYIIFVDLELYPGKEIPANKKISLGCGRNFEGIRKAWADLRGFEYRTIPLNYYKDSEKRINPSFKSQTMKNMAAVRKGGKSKTYKNKK